MKTRILLNGCEIPASAEELTLFQYERISKITKAAEERGQKLTPLQWREIFIILGMNSDQLKGVDLREFGRVVGQWNEKINKSIKEISRNVNFNISVVCEGSEVNLVVKTNDDGKPKILWGILDALKKGGSSSIIRTLAVFLFNEKLTDSENLKDRAIRERVKLLKREPLSKYFGLLTIILNELANYAEEINDDTK